jgi:hypothetical protein
MTARRWRNSAASLSRGEVAEVQKGRQRRELCLKAKLLCIDLQSDFVITHS